MTGLDLLISEGWKVKWTGALADVDYLIRRAGAIDESPTATRALVVASPSGVTVLVRRVDEEA